MQLREILDLEAMLTKDPAPESLEDEEEDDGEISEKNAGVSFKDEDEVEEEPEADSDDEEGGSRSEEHTSELQSLMRISYAIFCLKKKKTKTEKRYEQHHI